VEVVWAQLFVSQVNCDRVNCRLNISLVDPTVLVSKTENLLSDGHGFTVNQPKNPPGAHLSSS